MNYSLLQKKIEKIALDPFSSNSVSPFILVYQIALDPSLVPTPYLSQFQFVLSDLKPNECAN